jgi:hypothetical protein
MLVANIAYLCLGVYKLLSCATHALSLAGPPAEAHGKRYRTCGRTIQAELAVTSCTPRASVDRTWYKTWSSLGWGSPARVLRASSSEISRLLHSSSSDQHRMYWCSLFAAAAVDSNFTCRSLHPGQERSYDI